MDCEEEEAGKLGSRRHRAHRWSQAAGWWLHLPVKALHIYTSAAGSKGSQRDQNADHRPDAVDGSAAPYQVRKQPQAVVFHLRQHAAPHMHPVPLSKKGRTK